MSALSRSTPFPYRISLSSLLAPAGIMKPPSRPWQTVAQSKLWGSSLCSSQDQQRATWRIVSSYCRKSRRFVSSIPRKKKIFISMRPCFTIQLTSRPRRGGRDKTCPGRQDPERPDSSLHLWPCRLFELLYRRCGYFRSEVLLR